MKVTADARETLHDRLKSIHHTTTMEDLAILVQAIDTAMSNEILATTFDETLNQRRASLEREGAYGG